MNIDLNCFDDAKLGTLFYTAKCFSDYFQKKCIFFVFDSNLLQFSMYLILFNLLKIILKP